MTKSRAIDITGERFGRWTVVKRVKSLDAVHARARWQVRCDCGGVGEVNGNVLRAGESTSCGCRKSEASRANILKRNAMNLSIKPLDFQTGTDLAVIMRRRLS